MIMLSDREWAVLTALWDLGGGTLGAVTKALGPATGWSRNTVQTYLTRMEAKGLVAIDQSASPHIYRAALGKEDCRARERRSFLHRVYRGAAGELVTAFLQEAPLSAKEREDLRRLLDEMEV